MFASIVKSIKSIAKGPRVILAENIARVLSEHFVLDPADIQSCLLKDARIVLKNTQLRARRYRSDSEPNTVVSVKGDVEEVVFSWRWSLISGSSTSGVAEQSSYTSGGGMVQDVVLTIRGVKVQIGLDAWETLDEAEQEALVENHESASMNDDSEKNEPGDGTSVKEKEGFVQQYVKQVVDHLVLEIEDFEFTIQARSGPYVIITGEDLKLGTMSSAKLAKENEGSKTKARILCQRISIRSFFVNVRSGESEKPSPLIEPFGYAASVIRFSGERFQGGILSGLEIVGLPTLPNISAGEEEGRTDEGILFHIGLPQIQALSTLGTMLVPPSSCSAESTSSEELKGHDGSQSIVDQKRDVEEGGKSTVFNLPLPALTIVLPPSGPDMIPTKITLPRAILLYRADGKVFRIEGREGIKDNGTSLVTLASGGKWSVNFVKKVFDLDKCGGGCKISISDETVMRLSSIITSLSSADDITNLTDAWEGTKSLPADQIQKVTSSESWSISTGCLILRLTGGDNKWLEANVARSSANLSPGMDKLTKVSVGECTVRSSFDNSTAITVPPFTLLLGTLHISDTVEAAVGSVEDALQIRDFLLSFLQPFEQSNKFENKNIVHPGSGIQALPCVVKIDQLKLVVREPDMNIDLKRLCGEGTLFSCESATYTTSQSKVESQNFHLKCDLNSDVHMKIGTISSLVIPGVIALDEPVVDTSILYRREGMLVDMDKVRGTFERPHSQQTRDGTNSSNISIPFPIHLDLKLLILKEAGETVLIGMKNISMSVNQSGSTFVLECREDMRIRLKQSPNVSIDATMGKLSLQLQDDNGYFRPKQIQLSGAVLGPCSPSCGKLSIVVPRAYQEDGRKLSFEKNIDISFDSAKVFDNLRPLFDSIVRPQEGDPSDAFPFPVEIPGMNISTSEPPSKIEIGNTSAIRSNIFFGQVRAIVQNTISFSMKGLKADIMSRSLNVDCVESLTLPGIMTFSKPFLNLNLKLEREVLHIKILTPIHASMLSRSTGTVQLQKVPPTQQNNIDIPFQIKVRVAKASLKTLRKGDETCIQMGEIALDISPTIVPSQDLISGEVKKGTQISLEMENIKHDLFQAQNIHTSLILELQDLETLHQLQVSLDSPRVTAGFSTIDWSSLFNETGPNDKVQQKALKMPFAKVVSTSIFVSYKGAIVASQATVAVPEFKGNSFTTIDDLSTYYSNTVLKRIPGFLANVEVLGSNVADGTFATIGRVALGASSVTTAGVGSIVGTAVADGVKGAISAGKSARNVATDDAYKFGDISRGIVRGLSQATKKGAQSRGSCGSDYVPGDFTVGAVEAIGEYGEKNSRKLASAGASGVGATIGLALAGPLGFVVGSYLGSKAVGDGNGESQSNSKTFYCRFVNNANINFL
jgi:hypothetical protein